MCPSFTAGVEIRKFSDLSFGKVLNSVMRGVPLHIYYIQFSQYTHPVGSGRPPWTAGELNTYILKQKCTISHS